MTTFGEFFEKLRQRSEKTGRTDAACGYMDHYKAKRCTEPMLPLEREDRGWKAMADQKLSHSNLLEFSAEVTRAGVTRLTAEINGDNFDPDGFSWALNSVHEFHHAMLDIARECGLDIANISSWRKAKEEKKSSGGTQS